MDYDIFPDLSTLDDKEEEDPVEENEPWLDSLFPYTNSVDTPPEEKIEPLTTKLALRFLLEGTLKSKVCRYCLNITQDLSELDLIMNIGGTENIYKVTIRDIVATFHPFKVVEDQNFPNKICQVCIDRALGAYLFTQQCERAERAMLNCFDDIYEKFEKLDPIDRPKKRGRQKLNPNFNVLNVEHEKVIDYAEPTINIINLGTDSDTKDLELNDLECKKCWLVLPNVESLLNHEKIHPKTMWYHCRFCGKSFPKVNQLKRHQHKVHVLGKEVLPQKENSFRCRECDHITENYIVHLQHIEKHKFKGIMKHLIEKKMDRLCAICLDNGNNMVELDKMVRIHGGCTNLTGDKTLYSILSSTLPNPQMSKHQVLHLLTNAQVTTLVKKRKTGCDHRYVKKVKLLDCNIAEVNVPLTTNFDGLFMNSCNYTIQIFNEINFQGNRFNIDEIDNANTINKVNDDITRTISNSDETNKKSSRENLSITSNDNFNLSNDSVNVECNQNGDERENEVIFKNKMFKNDLNMFKTKSVASSKQLIVISEDSKPCLSVFKSDCKFCWIFKNLAKCDYCKKPSVMLRI